ncbi:MAG: hypothetical protein EB124_08875 [Betaproteobacteria bacterium]|nr:hypothetical protein [Betaproteobacteria bacterium]
MLWIVLLVMTLSFGVVLLADPAVMQTFAVNHRQIAAQSELLSPRLIKVQPAVVLSISPESLEIARMPQVLKGI